MAVRGRWGRCALCDRGYMESKRYCKMCYYFVCGRCDKAYEDEQIKERSDPAGKHTFIQCDMASEISMNMPPRAVDLDPASPATRSEDLAEQGLARQTSLAGSVPLSSDFSVTIEMKLLSLPPSGQLAALARFNSPDVASSMARRRHMASLYLNSAGQIGHNLRSLHASDGATPAGSRAVALSIPAVQGKTAGKEHGTRESKTAEKEEDKRAAQQVSLREGRWVVLTASVEVSAGRMTTYLDGKLLATEENLEPRDLSLGSKLVILGDSASVASSLVDFQIRVARGWLFDLMTECRGGDAGGGKAAQSRGGSVRRVLVHDVSLTAEQALSTYVACALDNLAISTKASTIQVTSFIFCPAVAAWGVLSSPPRFLFVRRHALDHPLPTPVCLFLRE